MSEWIGLQVAPPKVIEDVFTYINPVVDAISAFLNGVVFVLDIISFLIKLSEDFLAQVLNTAIDFLQKIINTLANIGFATFFYKPKGEKPEHATGYAGFLEELKTSLNDPLDRARPVFTNDNPFFALCLLLGYSDLTGINEKLKPFTELFQKDLFAKYTSVQSRYVPQAVFTGIIDPAIAGENTGFPATVLKLQRDKEGDLDVIKITQEGAVSFLAENRVVTTQTISAFASSSVNVILAIPDRTDPLNKGTKVAPFQVGNLVKKDDQVTVSLDYVQLIAAGNTGVFLAYVEVDETNKFRTVDLNYNVRIGELSLMAKESVKGDSAPYNWEGLALRNWEPFKDFIQLLEQGLRKFKVSSSITSGIDEIKNIITVIKDDLLQLVENIKKISQALESILSSLSAGINFLWITPWPTIISNKAPFRLTHGDSFSISLDSLTGATSPSGPGPSNIVFQATKGYHTGDYSALFSLPAGSSFDAEMYIRKSNLSMGSAAETLGFSSGTEDPVGVFTGTEVTKFRIPTSTSGVKLSTYGKGIKASHSEDTLLSMINFSTSYADSKIESISDTKYHYPSGASFRLTAWSNYSELRSGSEDLLPLIGLSNPAVKEDSSLVGNPATKFRIVPFTQAYISTKTLERAYLPSSITSILGLDTLTDTTVTTDIGSDVRIFKFPAIASFRVSLGIKSLKLLTSTSAVKLGLDEITEQVGSITGKDCFAFSSIAGSFTIAAFSNLIQIVSGTLREKLAWESISESRNTLAGIDSRYFAWPLNSGFSLEVRDVADVLLYSGTIAISQAGIKNKGSQLALQLTYALRSLPNASKTEFCLYNNTTGLFTFYFGPLAEKIKITKVVDPTLDITDYIGLPAGTHSLLSGQFNCAAPANYILNADTLNFKLGKEAFTVSLTGKYTGSDLAIALQTAIRTQTLRLENVTYNQANGRFQLTIDPVGYKWIDSTTLNLPAYNRVSPSTIVTALNTALNTASINATFSFEANKFLFFSEGINRLVLTAGTGHALKMLGFTPGSYTITDTYAGGNTFPFYFSATDNQLKLKLNKVDYTVDITPNQQLDSTGIIAQIQATVPNIASIYVNNIFSFSVLNPLYLFNDELITYGPSQTFTLNNLLLNLKAQFDTYLGNTLSSFTVVNGKLNINYPEMTNLNFLISGLGEDLLPILGLTAGGFSFIETYEGNYFKPYLISTGENDFVIKLGSITYTVTVPNTERFSGEQLAEHVRFALTSHVSNPPLISYNPVGGIFSVQLHEQGYSQLENALITLNPTLGLITGEQAAATLQTAIRALPNAAGAEVVTYANHRFTIQYPKLVGVQFANVPSKPSLIKMYGFSTAYTPTVNNRITSQLPNPYFVISPYVDFVYNISGVNFSIELDTSTNYETGIELASRITAKINSITSQNEELTYDASKYVFTFKPSSTGIKFINNQRIALAPRETYLSKVELATDITDVLDAAFPDAGLEIVWDDTSNKYVWQMPGLSGIELAISDIGHNVLDFIGFNPGTYSANVNKISSNIPIKNYVISSLCNNLSILLGNTSYLISMTPSLLVYTGEQYATVLQANLRAASGRNTTVNYSSDTDSFSIEIDPAGEYFIKHFSINTLSSFSGIFNPDTFMTPQEIANVLSVSRASAGALGSESFTYVDGVFKFNSGSNRVMSIQFEAIAPYFDLSSAFGFTSDSVLLENGICQFNPIKRYIIKSGENDILAYNLNGYTGTVTLPEGIYDSDISATITDSFVGNAQFQTAEIIDNKIVVKSNLDGYKYFNSPLVFSSNFIGNGIELASELQAMIRAASPDGDESVVYENSAFKILKQNILKVIFKNPSSAFPKVLLVLGIGFDPPPAPGESDIPFMAENHAVVFNEVAPYFITPSQNSFNIQIDTLPVLTIQLDSVDRPLKGDEVAELVQKKIQHRLLSLCYTHALSKYGASFDESFIPLNPSYIDNAVSDYNLDPLEKKLKASFFQQIDQGLQDALNIVFNPPENQMQKVPVLSEVYNYVLQGIESSVNTASEVSAGFLKSLYFIQFKSFSDEVFRLFKNNILRYVDPDNIAALRDVFRNQIDIAAANTGLSVGSVALSIWASLKESYINTAFPFLTNLVTEKYFYDVTCTYDKPMNRFIISSPSLGKASSISVTTASSSDIANHLGFNPGTVATGTGNVDLIHRVTATELANLILAKKYAAFCWGVSPFSPFTYVASRVQPQSNCYPHRYYHRDELPYSCPVVVHPVAANGGSAATMTVADVVNEPLGEIGFKTSAAGASGSQAFIGAFDKAGNPIGVPEQSFVYAFVAVLVIPGVSSLTDVYNNDIATPLGLPKYPFS